ncbi:hypothetical protein OH77DRAFT_1397368 [Trametes cingulata]|nr:hypothetical protein OH77DRAFT_1397368 [Trametes cingulata]
MKLESLQQKLETLEKIFELLPQSLPLNTSGPVQFMLDADDLEDLGIAGALNRCFELNWGMRVYGTRISERGDKLSATVQTLKHVLGRLTPQDDVGLVELWMDTLIQAAMTALTGR